MSEFGEEVTELIVLADEIDGAVASHAHQPGRRIVMKTLYRPGLHGAAKRVLNNVFGKIETGEADDPG